MSNVQIAIIAVFAIAMFCNVIASVQHDERKAVTYIGLGQLIHQTGSIILTMYVFTELC